MSAVLSKHAHLSKKSSFINSLTVAYVSAVWACSNVVPGDNKNPSRLEVVETFL